MAELARLALVVESRQVEEASRRLRDLPQDAARAEKATDGFSASAHRAERASSSLNRAAGALGAAFATIGFGVLARQAIELADAWTSMQSRLALATRSTSQLKAVTEELFGVAQRTRTGLSETVDLYTSLARSTKSLGLSQKDLVGVTETINQSLIISGASASAASAALVQLSQGFASGTLRGDELNSVLEQAPRLAQAIADGMKITVGELRALGAEGKITGAAVTAALQSQAEAISKEYGTVSKTVGQAFTQLNNSVMKFVGEADQAVGISRTLAAAISAASENIEGFAKVAGVLAGIVGLAMVGALGSYVATTIAATASTIALGAAMSGMSVSALAGAGAVRGLGLALSFFGGPIGVAIAAVAAGLGFLAIKAAEARAEGDRQAAALGGTTKALDAYEEAVGVAATATGQARVKALSHAEALRVEAGAAITAARALREKRLALAESEAAEKAVRADRTTSTILGAMAGAGSGFPTGALAATVPEAAAAREVSKAKADVARYTQEQAAAEARYAKILEGSSVPALKTTTEASKGATKASNDNAKATKINTDAIDEAAEAMRRAADASTAYELSLRQQVAEFGRSKIQIKEMEIAMAAAAAPTKEQGDAIRNLGDQLVGLMRGKEAIEQINGPLKTMHDILGDDPLAGSDWVSKMLSRLDEIQDAAWATGSAADDMFRAFKNKDWAGALSGLLGAIQNVQKAFAAGGSMEGKVGAIAGLAGAAGSAIGGRTGGAISGAASGAMAGFTLGGPVGAVIGGALGGLAGLFGGNAAKKREREEAERRKAEEAAARALQIANQKRDMEITLLELSGDKVGALAKRREIELASMDASNRALAQQIYALQDQAEAMEKAKAIAQERASLEIRLMEATGDAAGVLAARRREELAGLDEANRAYLQYIHGIEDAQTALATANAAVATARSNLQEAYDRESGAIQSVIDKATQLRDTMRDLGDSLSTGALAGTNLTEQYDRTRRDFMRVSSTAATGDSAAAEKLPAAVQAFLEASENRAVTREDYLRDVATARNAARAAEAAAGRQISVAQQQLDALNASVAGLIDISGGVSTVAVRISELHAALAAQQAAQAAADVAKSQPPPIPSTAPTIRAPDWDSYLASNADVKAWAEAGNGDPSKNLATQSMQDRAAYHWYNSGRGEGRTPYAMGGVFTNGIVSQPTTFHNSVMGEGGKPEAIMPLVRGPQGLGVRVSGDSDSGAEMRALREEVAKMRAEQLPILRSIAITNEKIDNRERLREATGIGVRGVEPDSPVQVAA